MEAFVAIRYPRTYRRSDGYNAPVADRSENVQDRRRTLSNLLCNLRLSSQGAVERHMWWTSCGRRGGLWRRRVLGGLAGFSGVLLIVWTDIRGYTKEYRRSVLQTFNLSILTTALISHAYSGLLTQQVGLATIAALPGTVCGAWLGSVAYKRLGDRGFQQAVMAFLFLSGVMLIWTSW